MRMSWMEENARPFREIESQIGILENRGVVIENKPHANQVLLTQNYYCVINEYKALF